MQVEQKFLVQMHECMDFCVQLSAETETRVAPLQWPLCLPIFDSK